MNFKKDNFYNTFQQRDRLFKRRLNLVKQDDFNQSLSNEIVKNAERQRMLKAETMFRLKELQDKIKADKEAQENLKKEDKKLAEQLQKEEDFLQKKKDDKTTEKQTTIIKRPRKNGSREETFDYAKSKGLVMEEDRPDTANLPRKVLNILIDLNTSYTNYKNSELLAKQMKNLQKKPSQTQTTQTQNTQTQQIATQTQNTLPPPAQNRGGSRRGRPKTKGANKGRK